MYSKDSEHHNDSAAYVEHVHRRHIRKRPWDINPLIERIRLEELFFPVSLRPLYWERSNEYELRLRECERHFAVVDEDELSVFAAVTDDYQLVTNKKAYEMAIKLAKGIFAQFSDKEIWGLNPFLTYNRAACEFDVTREVQVGQPLIAGEWIPIIRVVNSYNKTKALELNFGFFNPTLNLHMMSNRPLKFPHNAIGDEKSFDAWIEMIRKSNRVQDEIRAFEQKMNDLRNIQLSPTTILQLFSKYFEIFIMTTKKINDLPDSEQDVVREAMSRIHEADMSSHDFCNQYGANGYSLLLVLASCIERKDNSRLRTTDQQKLGKWSDELIASTQSSGFSWFDYIGREAANTITYYEMNK